MTLAEQLADLMKQHDLTDVALWVRRSGDRIDFDASAHSRSFCATSGYGDGISESPASAIADAIERLNAKRHGPVTVPDLEAA